MAPAHQHRGTAKQAKRLSGRWKKADYPHAVIVRQETVKGRIWLAQRCIERIDQMSENHTGRTALCQVIAMGFALSISVHAFAQAEQPVSGEPSTAVAQPQSPANPNPQGDQNQAEQPVDKPVSAVKQASPAPAADEMVSFSQFAEPISIGALIDFIAGELDVIIMQTDASPLNQAFVEFSAPIQTPKSALLSLLETLLTPKNFSLTRSPEGFYIVGPAANAAIDFSEGDFSPTRIIRTPLVNPSSLQTAISTALGGSMSSMKIVYLDELGLLISTGPPRLNEAITQVVNRIISEIKSQELHRIELVHIAAAEAKARVLELTGQALQAAAPAGGGGGGAPTGRVANLGNLRDRLLIDRPTNALIYRGAAEEADVVRQYVQIVDTPSRLIVKRYYAGTTASEICQVGERKGLGPTLQSAGGGAAGRPGMAGGGAMAFGSGFVLGAQDAETFTYYGTDAQHHQVRELVEQFADQAREETLVVEFYKLRNVSAADTADLLSTLLEQDDQSNTADSPFLPGSLDQGSQRGITRLGADPFGGQAAGQAPPADGGAPAADGEEGATITPAVGVSIIADEPNNQIIIRAPRRQQREFARIIERLDERRPQVYIEVKIVSINSTRDFQFSIDTVIGSPGSDTPIFTNFGLIPFGDTLTTPSSSQGITAAFLRNSYTPIVINALANEANAKLTSVPRILVNDNEEAELSATQEVSFASTSQVAGAPSITSTGGNVSAGTTLRVRPTISENGTIRLEYTIELSSFGVQPNPNLPPNKQSNNFTSIVMVPSDTTIVIGGMTLQNENNSIGKVPFLGDIPLLGLAFQKRVKSSTSQTIYVFITPRILRDDTFTDLRLLTRGPMQELDIAEDTPPLKPALIPLFDHETSSPVSISKAGL